MSERKRESLDTLICHTKEARLCQQSAVPSAAREQRDVSVRSVSPYRKGGFARAGVAPPFEFKMYMSAGSQPATREPLEYRGSRNCWMTVTGQGLAGHLAQAVQSVYRLSRSRHRRPGIRGGEVKKWVLELDIEVAGVSVFVLSGIAFKQEVTSKCLHWHKGLRSRPSLDPTQHWAAFPRTYGSN